MKKQYLKSYFNGHRKRIPLLVFNLLSFPIYMFFRHTFSLKSNIPKEDKVCFKILREESSPLKSIEKIYSNCEFFDLVIIGSYADHTQTPFSDIDGVVIIKPESFKSYKNFRELKKKLDLIAIEYQRIDPLQHHSHWIIFEQELKEYEQSQMPITTLRDAISIGKDTIVQLSEGDKSKTNSNLKNILGYQIRDCLDYSKKLFQNGLSLYELKSFISSLSLMPALYYQLKNKFIRKEVAIKKIEKELDRECLKALKFTSELRRKWGRLDVRYLNKKIDTLIKKKSLIDRESLEAVSKKDTKKVKIENLDFLNALVQKKELLNYINFFKI